jgi:hypothetical protein
VLNLPDLNTILNGEYNTVQGMISVHNHALHHVKEFNHDIAKVENNGQIITSANTF